MKDQDSLNFAAGSNYLDKMSRECLAIIESKSKVRYSRNKPVVTKVSKNTLTSGISPDVAKLKDMVKALLLDKKSQNQALITASTSSSGTLPSNTIANSKSDLKAITTQSGVSYDGPQILPPPSFLPKVVENEPEATNDTVHPTNNESTEDIQPQVVQSKFPILTSEPVNSPPIEPVNSPGSALRLNQRPSIPYPSRLQDQKLRDKANDQCEKFFQIIKDLNFNISFTDALILMPKFGPSIKNLLTNKDKLCELARTPLNEHYSEAECLALADLGASINLMPLFMWNKLSLLDLSPTYMTLELAGSISRPVGVAEDVYVKVEVELKGLPLHIEYALLEGNDKLPVIIVKDLSVEDKTALITEKTIFTFPYGTFAYRRMPFGLCNAPGTFQRCMMAIFDDKIKKTMEVFMDDFSVFENSFQSCLAYLERMLKRCEDTNLCLNWENSHLADDPSSRQRYPIPFLQKCVEAFQTLKRKLTEAPILISPNWDMPFELMYNASNFAIAYKTPIGCTSYKLIYGKACHLPIELEYKAYWALKHANFDLRTTGDHRKVQLNELRNQAYENSLIYKVKTKRLYDSKIKDRVFNIDDRVLLFNF
uniref:Reverse transcriptase domain-containing protein n=1 Tax=Tanacetum cinerariifolium TaxID=118510 RepID=A0A699IJY5_TANCI|nr:reverse transcriptase domain-containing protein [Tanacetum cinerariifolium]